MQLRKIKGKNKYFLSEFGDVFRIVSTFKRNNKAKLNNTVTICEDGKHETIGLESLMKTMYPEFYNVDLGEFFTKVEYDLWQRKLNTLEKSEWKKFNESIVMTIRNRRLWERGTDRRKQQLERLFEI